MSITLRRRVRPEPAGAELDQATSTLVLVALAATAPALLMRMLTAVGDAAGSSAASAVPMWAAVASVVRVLGLGGLAALGLACAAAAIAAGRPLGDAKVRGDVRVAALYAAGGVAAALGIVLLA